MKKLYRSSSNKVFLGVLGGLGDALNIEPLVLRILYVILALGSPLNLTLLYIIAALIIPSDEGIIYSENSSSSSNGNTGRIIGVGLIVLGIFFLLQNFLPIINLRIIPQLNAIFRSLFNFWPLLLIVLGVYIIYKDRK